MVKISDFLEKVFDFLFPPTCPLCGEGVSKDGDLCTICWPSFNWIDGQKCCKCGIPLAESDELMCGSCLADKCELNWIRSACVYDNASKCAILPFKHCGKIGYYKFLSNAMIWALRDVDVDIDVVMPVPLAWKRLYKRGYNQATLLAKPIAKVLNVKVDYDSVHRDYKMDMGHKTFSQRAKNIRGVFKVIKPENIRDKKILLIDDVMTSGSTFNELGRVLKKSGAKAVYGLSFCRVVRAI